MLGVAAEGLILRLADAIEGAFDGEGDGEEWYEDNVEGRQALAQFRTVRDKVKEGAVAGRPDPVSVVRFYGVDPS